MHESVKKYNDIVNSIKRELEDQKNIIFPKISHTLTGIIKRIMNYKCKEHFVNY